MKCFAKTDLGKARELNEDSYYIPSDENELRIYMLADGMGGYNGGEIASKLAIESARKYLTNNFNTITHDRINIEELIRSSMEYANMVVFEKSKEIPELEGMGTTLELVLSYGNKIYIGHVGDSRIYRVRKNIIRKLTTDHSYVEKLVKEGTITREEAENHPKKNMLMKALGCTPYVEPDVTTKGFLKGDVLLLTSDGLTNMVSNQEIYLADKKIQCTLSISLHATNDKKRSDMMPVNNAYPIEELMKACKYYIEKTNKRISFEYALAKDNNDNLEDAKELVSLLRGMLAHVNLIPINKIENGKFVKSTNNNIIKFRDYLNEHGIVATIRRELGSDIEAACGQLRRKTIEEKR